MSFAASVAVVAVCLWFPTPAVHASELSHRVAARVIPDTLDSQTVYPTNHVFVAVDPLRAYQWQQIELPQEWVGQGYFIELWDAGNRVVPGFAAQRLDMAMLDISAIDPSLTPSIRVVVFQPPDVPAPLYQEPVFFSYTEQPNLRLLFFLGLAAAMGLAVLCGAAYYHIGTRDVVQAIGALVAPQQTARLPVHVVTWCIVIMLASGVFGVALGTVVGGVQIIYLLIKLPFLLLCACALTVGSQTVLSLLLGVRATASQIVNETFRAITIVSLALASLSTVVLFFSLLHDTHDHILLLTLLCVGAAAVAGALQFYMWVRRSRGYLIALFATGICALLYAVVFLQLGWMLRPWIGVLDPIQQTVPFARLYSGNVFVEVFAAVSRIL